MKYCNLWEPIELPYQLPCYAVKLRPPLLQELETLRIETLLQYDFVLYR